MYSNDSTRSAGSPSLAIREAIVQKDVSSYVLQCIKALNDGYPEPADLTGLRDIQRDHNLGQKVIGVLRDQEFISGPEDRTFLTLAGFKSVQSACAADVRVAQFLSGRQSGVANFDPRELLLAVFRAHFHEWRGKEL